jgi:hypothetical protein
MRTVIGCADRCAGKDERAGGATQRTSGKASLNLRCSRFQAWLRPASTRLSASDVVIEPVVISSECMKETRPVRLQRPGIRSGQVRYNGASPRACRKGRDAHRRHAPRWVPLVTGLVSGVNGGMQRDAPSPGGNLTWRSRSSCRAGSGPRACTSAGRRSLSSACWALRVAAGADLDAWGLEGILGREEQHAVVLSAGVGRVGRAPLVGRLDAERGGGLERLTMM